MGGIIRWLGDLYSVVQHIYATVYEILYWCEVGWITEMRETIVDFN